jgi:uncharacterized protein YukE
MLNSYESDIFKFVQRYVLGNRSDEATPAMRAGSGFDALVKQKLGGIALDARVAQDTWALEAGRVLLQAYEMSNAYAALQRELARAAEVRYDLDETVPCEWGGEEFRLRGLPDLAFKVGDGSGSGTWVIFDWKVSGYCSRASVAAGYLRKNGTESTAAVARKWNGISYNMYGKLKPEWHTQVAIYSYILNGLSETVVGIDQLACDLPRIDVGQHRVLLCRQDIEAVLDRCAALARAMRTRDWTPEITALEALHVDYHYDSDAGNPFER